MIAKEKAQAKAAKEARVHATLGTTATHASRLRVRLLTSVQSVVATTSAALAHRAEHD